MGIRTGGFRSAIVFVVAAVSLMVMALPAFAQYPPPPPSSTTGEATGPEEAQPGSTVTFQGDGFQPGTEATVTLTGAVQGTATVSVNDQGVASYTFSIECDAQSGEATITFSGTGTNGAARTESTTFTVTQDEAAVCEEEEPPAEEPPAEEPPAEEPPAEEPPAQPDEPAPAPEPGDDGDGSVGGEGDQADEDGLAATGGEFTTAALLAVFALLVGAGFLIAGRRRRETGEN